MARGEDKPVIQRSTGEFITDPDEKTMSGEAGVWLSDTRVPEPVLAPLLRQRMADRHVITVHAVDQSAIAGRVEDVAEDGSTVTIVSGRDEYTVDVSLIAVIQTRSKTEK